MYKSITACEGWFHVDDGKFTRVAAWAVTGDDDVIGLVYVEGEADRYNTPRLAKPTNGKYVHKDDLSQVDRFNFESRHVMG